jgi:hypothetical protein
MKKTFLLTAVAAALTLGSLLILRLQAEPPEAYARYDHNLVMLPLVMVGDAQFEMDLQRQNAPDSRSRRRALDVPPLGATFRVVRSVEAAASDGPPALLKNNVLRIPVIQWGELSYRLELRALDSNPEQFTLSAAIPLNAPQQGYSALSDGFGGFNFEAATARPEADFDKARSLAAFQETLYPYLRKNVCSNCHSRNLDGTPAQAPMHTDWDVDLAHEYALTRVNFADPANSKFVVRMRIDRHNCPKSDCATAAANMLDAINAWKTRIAGMLPQTPRGIPADAKVAEADVVQRIAEDRAALAPEDRDYIIYTSMHELHNEGLSADELNTVRAGLSKALNSVARWAPRIVNPVSVNSSGLLYKFDIRDYWGWNKGVTRLLFGGSDDDLAFGRNKRDYRGDPVDSSVQRQRYNYSSAVSRDPAFSKTIWERVLHGNVEGAVTSGTIPAYIDGFRGKRSRNAAGEYIAPPDFEWVETAQLIYTLTRPDVYNAIMMIPMTTDQLEDELGVDKSRGMDSYDYLIPFDSIAVDSRLLWRANTKSAGSYWKTWDVFSGQLAGGDRSIFDVYKEGGTDIRFPWWANPIPVFVDPNVNRLDTRTWSFVASLALPFGTPPPGCDPQPSYAGGAFSNCRHFSGTGGLQQAAEEMIWSLPNGLQGYMLGGAFNQRRVDAFVNIVRDPRAIPAAADDIGTQTGFTFHKQNGGLGGFNDPRLNVGSSCIGCHIDGLNRVNNDLRDWLDRSSSKLPKGPYGVDGWINNSDTVKRVRELYPPSTIVRGYVEEGRQTFLGSMAQIKQAMLLGSDKNLYVEPVIWTVEYVQRKKYRYPQTTSN